VLDGLGQPRVAPGGGASVYGSWPSGSKSSFGVTFGNIPASLNFIANDGKLNRGFQIGLQVPTDLPPGDTKVVVSFNGVAGPPSQ